MIAGRQFIDTGVDAAGALQGFRESIRHHARAGTDHHGHARIGFAHHQRRGKCSGNHEREVTVREFLAHDRYVVGVGARQAPLDDQVASFDQTLLAQLVGKRLVEFRIANTREIADAWRARVRGADSAKSERRGHGQDHSATGGTGVGHDSTPLNDRCHDTPVTGTDVCRSVFVACPGRRQKKALM